MASYESAGWCDSSLIVFSHLRWNFVYQRPQHVVSRLARRRRVLFVEEPLPSDGRAPFWERESPLDNLTVCRPRTPIDAPGFGAAQTGTLTRMVRALLAKEGAGRTIAWLYMPMALPLARAAAPDTLVYDCMDELSAFLGAPPELVAREEELLAAADVVFTGGRSLYRAKRTRNPNVHCLPSSVDVAHFGRARAPVREPADQAAIPHPRLGFCGVLDERLDLAAVDALARVHPEWHVVMVGPTVKVDAAALPRHPNLHYLGQRAYDDLPAYIARWDVCLLPFALNPATRFISPTKTLEYMAAGRPIVSTPITDVVDSYGDTVYVGDGAAGFLAACERALAAPAAERAHRQSVADKLLSRTSWDRTVARMESLLPPVTERAASGATA